MMTEAIDGLGREAICEIRGAADCPALWQSLEMKSEWWSAFDPFAPLPMSWWQEAGLLAAVLIPHVIIAAVGAVVIGVPVGMAVWGVAHSMKRMKK